MGKESPIARVEIFFEVGGTSLQAKVRSCCGSAGGREPGSRTLHCSGLQEHGTTPCSLSGCLQLLQPQDLDLALGLLADQKDFFIFVI